MQSLSRPNEASTANDRTKMFQEIKDPKQTLHFVAGFLTVR